MLKLLRLQPVLLYNLCVALLNYHFVLLEGLL